MSYNPHKDIFTIKSTTESKSALFSWIYLDMLNISFIIQFCFSYYHLLLTLNIKILWQLQNWFIHILQLWSQYFSVANNVMYSIFHLVWKFSNVLGCLNNPSIVTMEEALKYAKHISGYFGGISRHLLHWLEESIELKTQFWNNNNHVKL